jgi:endonuclease G
MKKYRIFLFFVSFVVLASFLVVAQQKTTAIAETPNAHPKRFSSNVTKSVSNAPRLSSDSSLFQLEIPQVKNGESPIFHVGFSLLYAEKFEQATWVAYHLTAAETEKVVARTNRFLEDPKVVTGSATNDDYQNSVYDRGHLAPAADMAWSLASMQSSFYYSNMSPQLPGFNRGVWKRLEELVRQWALNYLAVYVVTGPVLETGLPTIGQNKVAVPKLYYKVLLDMESSPPKAIGFVLKNESSSAALQEFAVTVDSVERLTGIDFFAKLPDPIEKQVEGQLCVNCWTWNAHIPKGAKGTPKENEGDATQCSGITKAGNRCTRQTKNPNGRCFQHE